MKIIRRAVHVNKMSDATKMKDIQMMKTTRFNENDLTTSMYNQTV